MFRGREIETHSTVRTQVEVRESELPCKFQFTVCFLWKKRAKRADFFDRFAQQNTGNFNLPRYHRVQLTENSRVTIFQFTVLSQQITQRKVSIYLSTVDHRMIPAQQIKGFQFTRSQQITHNTISIYPSTIGRKSIFQFTRAQQFVQREFNLPEHSRSHSALVN